MGNTKTVGNTSEAMVIARLVELGYPVLIPFGDNERYDLVVEIDGSFKRVQVKTARLVNGTLSIPVSSSHYHANGKRKSYKGQVDTIMAYSPDTKKVYKLDINDVGTTEVRLRISDPKFADPKIRNASNYEF